MDPADAAMPGRDCPWLFQPGREWNYSVAHRRPRARGRVLGATADRFFSDHILDPGHDRHRILHRRAGARTHGGPYVPAPGTRTARRLDAVGVADADPTCLRRGDSSAAPTTTTGHADAPGRRRTRRCRLLAPGRVLHDRNHPGDVDSRLRSSSVRRDDFDGIGLARLLVCDPVEEQVRPERASTRGAGVQHRLLRDPPRR